MEATTTSSCAMSDTREEKERCETRLVHESMERPFAARKIRFGFLNSQERKTGTDRGGVIRTILSLGQLQELEPAGDQVC